MKALRHPRASELLVAYYNPSGRYAGGTFLDLKPNPAYEITPTDLYALSLLDVRAKPRGGRRLLESGPHRDRVRAALKDKRLPQKVDLRTADDETFAAAEELYIAVKTALGDNPWVTASKLCARKRPRFFPVRDNVVTVRRLELGKSWLIDWKVFQHLLNDSSLEDMLAKRLLDANEISGSVAITDPPLRVLDVLLWMTATPEMRRRTGRAPGGKETYA